MCFTTRLFLAVTCAVLMASPATAEVDITISDELLNATNDGGSFLIRLESTAPPETAGAYNLDLTFSDFVGVSSVTVDSFVFESPQVDVIAPAAGTYTSGVPIGFQGLFGSFVDGGLSFEDGSPIDFLTVNFSLDSALTPGDSFTVGFAPNNQVIADTSVSQNNIIGVTGTQFVGVSAVPEPGSLAFCGLLVAGAAGRRWKKARK